LDADKNYAINQTISLNLDEIFNISSAYSVVSTTVTKKSSPIPVNVTIPSTKDKIIETDG
jgi:hypothetical protein